MSLSAVDFLLVERLSRESKTEIDEENYDHRGDFWSLLTNLVYIKNQRTRYQYVWLGYMLCSNRYHALCSSQTATQDSRKNIYNFFS